MKPWLLFPAAPAPAVQAGKRAEQQLLRELVSFVRAAPPGAAMRGALAARLARYPRTERRRIVSQVVEGGCSALFLAAREGQLALVEYLLVECDADIEQRGEYEVTNDRTRHLVTPLWCAAVAGRLPVVRLLCRHGADVNCQSDSGSTPVRSACFMTHLEVVRFLVEEAGADIQRANHSGGTCLINSVQSVELCRLLIGHGAAVNAVDIQHKSALHYAIQEHRAETTRLLLDSGADPFIVSKAGDDALQTACLKGDAAIFALLQEKVTYSTERLADAYELLGATFVDEHRDIPGALQHWRRAVQIRHGDPDRPMLKQTLPPNQVYLSQTEFTTHSDLDELETDWDSVRIQSLLVTERVLGVTHKDTTFRLMYRGAAYADALLFQRCVDLWLYALQLRVQRDRALFHETCFTAQALVRLLLDVLERRGAGPGLDTLQYRDVSATLDVIGSQLGEAARLVRIRPAHQRQQREFDLLLSTLARLVHLLVASAPAGEPAADWRRRLYRLLRMRPTTCVDSSSLLHIAVSGDSRTAAHGDNGQSDIFPSAAVAAALIDCGAEVDAVNDQGVTPLLAAARATLYHPVSAAARRCVAVLLSAGAHLDRHCSGVGVSESPLSVLDRSGHRFCRARHVPLRCLAARVVSRHLPIHLVPEPFREWVDQH